MTNNNTEMKSLKEVVTKAVTPSEKVIKNQRGVTLTMQRQANQYIELQKLYRKIEARMKVLRESLVESMEVKGIDTVYGETGECITLSSQSRPEVTARYSAYSASDIEEFIPKEYLEAVMTKVPDRDVVDALIGAGKLPSEIRELQRVKKQPMLLVKKG